MPFPKQLDKGQKWNANNLDQDLNFGSWLSFLCDPMLGIRYVDVWVPVRGSLCLFWRVTHTKGLCVRFPTRSKENEGRKVQEIVSRREQTRQGQSRDENWPVERTDQSTEVRGNRQSRKTFEDAGWPMWENESAFLEALWEFHLSICSR